MKTSTRLILLGSVLLALACTLAVIGQPSEPPELNEEPELEEFVPSEQVSFDKTLSWPVDI